MPKDPFLAHMRAEGILNSTTYDAIMQWWTAENVVLFQNALSQYVEAETRENRLILLDEVCAVILAALYSLSKELQAGIVTTGLLSCLLETVRCIFSNGDIVYVAAPNFISTLFSYLVVDSVALSLYDAVGIQFLGNMLYVAAGIAKYTPETPLNNYYESFQSIVDTLLSGVPEEERTILITSLIQASVLRLSPFHMLSGRPNTEYYEFLVKFLSSVYKYPSQLSSAINKHITNSCSAIEADLTMTDKDEGLLLNNSSVSDSLEKAPCLDPLLFLMLESGVYYFFCVDSDDERAITLNVIRDYTQHFFTLWIPFVLDLKLRDAEVGILFCSVFLERYRQMHYAFLDSSGTIGANVNIEKSFHAIHRIQPRLFVNHKSFFIFNSNYPLMYNSLQQQQDTHSDEAEPSKGSQRMRNEDVSLSSNNNNDNTMEKHISKFYTPKQVSIVLPCSMKETPLLDILGSVIYSVILIGLTSHTSELRRRALDAAENLLWSINYTFTTNPLIKSGKLPTMKMYAEEINNVIIPLVKDRFIDSCDYVREASITIFASYYRSLLEYLDYTTTINLETMSEDDRMFVTLLERLDKLVEPHVYIKPLKIQMPFVEHDTSMVANEEMISLSLEQRLNDKSIRVRSATTVALQSLYIAGYHRLATSLLHYTYKFGLEGELEFFRFLHANTNFSICSIMHRMLTFFDSINITDFYVLIRVLARQKLLRKIVESTFTMLATKRHSATLIKKQWDEAITNIYGSDQDIGTQTYFNSFYDYMIESAHTKTLAEFMSEGEALLDTIYDKHTKTSRDSRRLTVSESNLHLSRIEGSTEYVTVAQKIKNRWLFLHIFSFPFCYEALLHKIVKLTSGSYYSSYIERQKDTEVFQTSSLTCALLLRSILIVNPQLFIQWKHLSIKFFFNVFEETKALDFSDSSSPAPDQSGNPEALSLRTEKERGNIRNAASKFIEFSEGLGLGILSSKVSDTKTATLNNMTLHQSDLATPSSEPDTALMSTETDLTISNKVVGVASGMVDTSHGSQEVITRADQISLAIIGIHVAILMGEYIYISESQIKALFNINNEIKEIHGTMLVDLASTAFNLASIDRCACLATRNMLFKHVTSCPWTILALYSSFHEWDVAPACNINYRYAIYYNLIRRLCSTCKIVPDELWGRSWSMMIASSMQLNDSIPEDMKKKVETNIKPDVTQNPLLIELYDTLIEQLNTEYHSFNKQSTHAEDVELCMEKSHSLVIVFPEFVKEIEGDHISSLSKCLFVDIDTGTELLIQTPYLKCFHREDDRIISILPVLAYGSHLYALSKDSTQTSKLISYYSALIEATLFPFTIKIDNTQTPAKVVQQVSPVFTYDLLSMATRTTIIPVFKLLEAVHTLLLFQLRTDQRVLQLQTSYSLFMMLTAAHYGLIFSYFPEENQYEYGKTITSTTVFGRRTMQKTILHGISSTTLRILLTCVEFGNMPCRLIGVLIAAFASYVVGYCNMDLALVFNNDEESALLNSANDECGVVITISKNYIHHKNMKYNIPDVPGKNTAASITSTSTILAETLPSPTVVKQSITKESVDFMHKFVAKLINISFQAMEQFPISFMLRQEAGSSSSPQIAVLSGRPEYSLFVLIYIVHNYIFQIACSMANQHRITVLNAAKYLVSRKTGITLFIDTAILLLLEVLMHSATNIMQSSDGCGGSLAADVLSDVSAPQFTISILRLCIAKASYYSTRVAGDIASASEEARIFLYKTVLSVFAYRIKTFTDYKCTLPLDVLLQVPSALFVKDTADSTTNSGDTESRNARSTLRQSAFGAMPAYVKERAVTFAQNSELLDNLAKISLTPKNKLASPCSSSSLRETPRRRSKI